MTTPTSDHQKIRDTFAEVGDKVRSITTIPGVGEFVISQREDGHVTCQLCVERDGILWNDRDVAPVNVRINRLPRWERTDHQTYKVSTSTGGYGTQAEYEATILMLNAAWEVVAELNELEFILSCFQ